MGGRGGEGGLKIQGHVIKYVYLKRGRQKWKTWKRYSKVSLALLHLASFPFNVRNKQCSFCTKNEFQGLHDITAPNTR